MNRIPGWYRHVLLFFLGWVFLYGDRTILSPALDDIGREWRLSASQLGLVSSVFFLTYTAFQIPSALLADRWGRKRVLVPGYVFFGLTTALMGLAPSYGLLLLWSALGGLGQSTYYAAQYSLSSEAIPPGRLGLGSAMINSGMAVGTSLGLLVASGLSEMMGASWRLPFLAMAVPTVLVGLLIGHFIPEGSERRKGAERPEAVEHREAAGGREAPGHSEAAGRSEAPPSPQADRGSFKAPAWLKEPTIVWMSVANFCSLYGFFLILTWLPYYLQSARGMAGVQTGVVASLVPWVSIPAALFFSSLSDRLRSRRQLMAVLYGVAALAMAFIPYAATQAQLIFLLVVYGAAGKLTVDPIMVAYVAESVQKSVQDEGSAGAFGFLNFAGMVGSVLAPVITGVIVDASGRFEAAFSIGGLLLALGMLGVLMTSRRRQLGAQHGVGR